MSQPWASDYQTITLFSVQHWLDIAQFRALFLSVPLVASRCLQDWKDTQASRLLLVTRILQGCRLHFRVSTSTEGRNLRKSLFPNTSTMCSCHFLWAIEQAEERSGCHRPFPRMPTPRRAVLTPACRGAVKLLLGSGYQLNQEKTKVYFPTNVEVVFSVES